jgi:D-alanyl-D-alanine carboxypeptidase/D-alanyl-D-alanine-endopeptidase (penicillin-binding protein 4)
MLSAVSVVVQAERAPAVAARHDASPLVTPVLSARRVPDLLAAPVADRRLVAHLTDLLSRAPRDRCLTVAIGGRTVFSENPAAGLTPASVEKLMTAQAALLVLGPNAVFTTRVVAGAPPANGTLNGDLFVVGGGDPLLMTDPYVAHFKHQPVTHTDLAQLAARVRNAGVTHITGSIVGDDSRYDEQRYLPQWPARFATMAEIGPMSALLVNDGLVAFPPTPDAHLPKETPADDPSAHAADQLTQLLVSQGVTVDGAPRSGRSPDGATEIAKLDSQPLGQIIAAMLTESDNSTAELLTKELGLHDAGAGTTAAGVAAITKTLQALPVPLDQTARIDGSGLADADKETCVAVQALLDRQGRTSPLAVDLPVAGQTGTLAERFLGTPLVGRLRAKTGTLNQATALAGYLDSTQGTAMSFAFIMNVPAPQRITTADVGLEDELAGILAQYPESVDVAKLGPVP